jgi:hypothetical protein
MENRKAGAAGREKPRRTYQAVLREMRIWEEALREEGDVKRPAK